MDDYTEDVNAIGGWTNQPRGKFGLANNGFSWRETSNQGQNNHNNQRPNSQPYQTPQRRQENTTNAQAQQPKRTIEEIVGQLADTFRKSEERNDKRFGQLEA